MLHKKWSILSESWDILQQFTMRKAIAHTIKSFSLGWLHEIDTAPPAYYARRFKTSFGGKVQSFREPEDRVARFARRLSLGIESGTIPCPTFINPSHPSTADVTNVTLDEAVDFAVRVGGHLTVARSGFLRSRMEEVEAFLDTRQTSRLKRCLVVQSNFVNECSWLCSTTVHGYILATLQEPELGYFMRVWSWEFAFKRSKRVPNYF